MTEPTERDRNIAWAIFTPWLGIPNTVPLVWKAIAAARAEERERAIAEAVAILHEEGWLGKSEQRICALARIRSCE